DREKAGSLEIIPLEFGVVWKQKVDIRMNIGSPSSGSHPGIDFASGEEIELGSSLRNTLWLEPVRRLPVGYAAHSFGKACHGLLVETVLVCEQTSRPNRRGGQPVLHANPLASQVSGRTDARAFVNIDIGMAEHPFNKNGNGRIAERFVLQIGDI